MADETETPPVAHWTVTVRDDGPHIEADMTYKDLHFWMSHVLRDLEDTFFERTRNRS